MPLARDCRRYLEAFHPERHNATEGENMTTPIQQIRARSLPKMEAYQTDLDHDQRWLAENPGRGFVHITTSSATHIYAIPDGFGKNEAVPYLFGISTAREIAHGELVVIAAMDKAGASFQFCPSSALREDLREVLEVSGRQALHYFRAGYEASCSELNRRGGNW